jgi:uncharacterized membrane protein HdeD (DUF308 family)
VLAFVVFASLPNVALWLIGLLLGVQLIGEGAAIGYLAWQERTAMQAAATPPPAAPV